MIKLTGNDIFLAIPLPPGAPDVVDWSERHMDLKWQEPLDDGGAAVTSYHIEGNKKFFFNILKSLNYILLSIILIYLFFNVGQDQRRGRRLATMGNR